MASDSEDKFLSDDVSLTNLVLMSLWNKDLVDIHFSDAGAWVSMTKAHYAKYIEEADTLDLHETIFIEKLIALIDAGS